LRTCRACGARPNEILLTPRMVCTAGRSFLRRRIAPIVSGAALRNSSLPLPSVNVKRSKKRSSGRMPYCWVTI